MDNVNFLVVFTEGLFSFFSPCILPILPIYLSLLSNSNVRTSRKNSTFLKTDLYKNTLFFALGISSTFFILGACANTLNRFLTYNKNLISFIGGIVIILMGLFYLDIIKFPLLNKNKKFDVEVKNINIFTAYILGFTFSFGWTPCIGPILASVLIMISTTENSFIGWILVLAYTLGFIIPFLIVSLFYNKLIKSINKIKTNINIIKKLGGLVLIICGVTILINNFNKVKTYFSLSNNKSSTNYKENVNNNISKEKSIDFVLYDQYGTKHKLSDYIGKTVFLNFWATWCPPCKKELPNIEKIYDEYNNDDIVILTITAPNLGQEGSKEDIINFLNQNKYKFPVLFDNNVDVFYQYKITSLPSTFIIDKEGYISEYVPGAMDKDTMKEIIENN